MENLSCRSLAATASCFLLFSCMSSMAMAQSTGSPGGSWSGTWNFSSAGDRNVGLSTAQAIRAARIGATAPVYNTYNSYDNRSNFQEYNGGDGATMGGAFQIGDTIGQNTNSIGSMNTGTTTIDIAGSGNSVNATNGADNAGCVDGSVNLSTIETISPTSDTGIDISVGGTLPTRNCR